MRGKSKLSIFVLLLILILSLTLGACSVSTETSSSSFVSTSESETENPGSTFETDSSTSSIVDDSKTSTEEDSTSSEESKADDSKTDSPTASNTESSTVDSSTTSTDNSKVDSSASDTSSSSDFNTEVPTPTPVPTSYSITVDTAIANGSITANKETAKEGETVTLTNSANLGYGFTSYTVTKENGTNVEVNGNTFVMPASKVRVTASFTQIDYTITVTEPTGGKISVSSTTVHYGDTITLSNTPATGYSFTSYTVNGKVQTENTFTMPASDITVTGSFTQIDYTITVTQPSNGTITVSKTTAHYGDTITLGNTPGTGYNFTSYTVNGKTQTENTFTMPASDITVTGSFTQIDYTITVTQPSNGTITVSKTTAHYGDTITLGNTPGTGYNFTSYTVNGKAQTANTFTMPANDVTVSGTFTIKSFNVTVTQPTGGTIKANESTSFTVNYGTKITLTNSASAGYIFSSYKVNNVSQTANTYTVTSNTTVTGVFNKGIGGLTASSFTGKVNSDSSATGSVTIDGSTVTSTQNKYPFVYSKVQGDFYYEVEVSITSICDNDPYPKAGIGIECNNEKLFYFIDAMPNGYNNQGFGTNKYVMCVPGSGTFASGTWAWGQENQFGCGKWFDTGYANGSYVKLAVLRVGGLYRFFVDGNYAFSVWMPNMDDTSNVGIASISLCFNAKNAKIGTGDAVADNARAYYGLTSSKNPTSATINGNENDWGENLVNQYGLATSDASKYFFASAFKGSDGVYVIYKIKTDNWITESSNWWESNNIEIHSGSAHIYANAKGEKEGISDVSFYKYQIDNTGAYYVTVEAKIPYSVWGANNSSATINMAFACKSNDPAQLNFTNDDESWWCGANWGQIGVTTTGLNLTRETTPTENVIKLSSFGGADPYILLAGDQYFMYATTGVTQGFRVYVSDDLYNWRNPTTADFTKWGVTPNTEQSSGWCFHVNWSKPVATTDLWAPEVKYNPTTKKYVMFYSGGKSINDNTVPKSGVATSDTPLGPFIDANNGTPMIYATDNNIASIDATCFLDTDGQAYIFYSKDCSWNYIENYHNGQGCNVSQTWGVKLNSSWTGITGTPVLISTPEQDWEFADGGTWFWNEGPFVYKQNGKYFLTYSANNYGGENYGVGLAISTSPLGTYKKYEGNPIVTKETGKTTGTGHGMMFTDKNGKMWYTFHTYLDLTNVAYNKTRVPLIARMWFHNGIPTIEYKNW